MILEISGFDDPKICSELSNKFIKVGIAKTLLNIVLMFNLIRITEWIIIPESECR